MRNLIKALSFCALLALATPAFAQIGLSIRIGAPPPPVPEVVVAAPFAGAIWVPGYYFFDFGIHNYRWIGGTWQHPPYAGARWIAPRYDHGAFIAGRWDRGGAVAYRGGGYGRGGGYARGGFRGGRAPMAR